MKNEETGGLHVVSRVALLLYLLHLGGCTWLYASEAAQGGRPSSEMIQFLAIVAAGLPWTLAVLALPAIVVDLAPYAAGEGFSAMVHALAIAAIVVNLVVLNRFCEWGRWLRGRRAAGVAS